MTPIDKTLISNLLAQAAENPRLRQNYDLRSSEGDGSQRMLNAMLPGRWCRSTGIRAATRV